MSPAVESATRSGAALSSAELAVLSSRLSGISRKMAHTLLRTGRSGVLSRARDFSCCIVSGTCELISAAESLPIHVLSGPEIMARHLAEVCPQPRRGDAFLNNSPYHGGSHPADHTVLVPVIDHSGVHRFTVLTKAHQADIGNSVPTSYFAAARDVYEEGALIFPTVKVQDAYADCQDIIRMCEARIRVPSQWYADFCAMIAAARIGERELLALGSEIGWARLDAFQAQWLAYSEQRMRLAIAALPAGRSSASCTHDPFPGTVPEGVKVNASVEILPGAGRIIVDLRRNVENLPCGLNLSEACARTAALLGVFNSIDPTIPKNAGSFRCVEVRLKQGCAVGIPAHPASCSVATTNLADRAGNAVQLAFAQIAAGLGMAEAGAGIPAARAVISGVDPRTGERFVNQVFLGSSGGAASPGTDGWLTYMHLGNGGMCFLDSVEQVELYHPIQVAERRILRDTEGAGEWRGAPSLRVEYAPVSAHLVAAFGSDGSVHAAQGVRGGGAGGAASQYKRDRGGHLMPLANWAVVTVESGEAIVSITCGGGGYGSPRARDRSRLMHDVEEGWISARRAEEVYGLTNEPGDNPGGGSEERDAKA